MSQTPSAPTITAGAFLEGLIRFLMPFFIDTTVDADSARAEILETIASYGARTRAEALNAARIIAFSMATLDTLAQAQEADLSPSMRVRYRGCANGLNRSTIQNEKTLEKRLASEPPEPVEAPINDLADLDAQIALDLANATIEEYRSRTQAARAIKETQQGGNKQLGANAMINTSRQMGAPNAPAAPA